MTKDSDGNEIPDLSKVQDPFTEKPEGEQPADAPKPEPSVAELKAQLAAKDAELESARKIQVVVQPQAPTPPPQPQMTQEQLQAQAESLGFTDPKQVESIGKIAAAVAAPAWQKANLLEAALLTERVVNQAKKAALQADPQFSKLEPFVDEFLDGVPVEDKMNPDKLKGHMERAQFYARGKMGNWAPSPRRQVPNSTPKGEDDDKDGKDKGGNMTGPEVYTTADGKTRIVVQPRVPDHIRKMHTHPSIEGGVQMDPRDEWVGPKFDKTGKA